MYTVLNANPTLISLSLCPRERTNRNTMDTLNSLSWPSSGLDPWDYQSRGPRRAPFSSPFTHQHHLCSYPEGRGSIPEIIRASESWVHIFPSYDMESGFDMVDLVKHMAQRHMWGGIMCVISYGAHHLMLLKFCRLIGLHYSNISHSELRGHWGSFSARL